MCLCFCSVYIYIYIEMHIYIYVYIHPICNLEPPRKDCKHLRGLERLPRARKCAEAARALVETPDESPRALRTPLKGS